MTDDPSGDADDAAATQDPTGGAASPRDGDLAAELPRRLGRYHVLERIGAGGMSVVFAAYDPELDRKIAVKLLRPDYDRDSQVRLLREAQALARLSHPNVVQIHDAGSVGQRVFLAMEFVAGLDLRAWLAAAPRSQHEVLRIFVAAGRGLAAAHAQGLVHRDFKPENVLVGADGRVCVADFGLVRAGVDLDEPPQRRAPGGALTLDMTTTGTTLGTPAYMSPEQHLGVTTDARSDQFSFCVALWEALCGQRPFLADSLAATAHAVVTGQLRGPPAHARVSRHLQELLRRGLQARPEQRFPDIPALLQQLTRDPARTRRRWLAGAAATLLLLAGTWRIAERSAREADACSGGALALAADWNPERRQALATALQGDPDPSLRARVLAGLDARAAAWLAGQRDACLDQRRGEQSSAVFDARVRCLGRRRQALGRAVDILLTPGAAPDPLLLVARLPSVRACADPDAAGAEASATDDPALAQAGAELDARLIAARTLHHAGDERRAHAAAEAVVTAARYGELRPLLAEALLLLADISTTVGDVPRARELLAEAAPHALATGRDAIAAEALARQLFLDGLLGEQAKAEATAPLARAIAERLPAPGPALARLDNNLGTLAHNAGDLPRARQHFERATAELRRTPDADPLELANYWTNLGIIADEVTTRDLAFAEATTLLVRELGEDHLQTLTLRLRHATYEPDLERGAALLTDACPRYLARGPRGGSSCGVCFHRLGLTEALLGHHAAARAAFGQVPACLRTLTTDPAVNQHFALLRSRAGAALALLDQRPAEAEALAAAGLRWAEPDVALWWVALEVAELQLVRGAALLALARPAAARDAFTRARDLLGELARTHPDALLPRWRAAADAGLAATSAAP